MRSVVFALCVVALLAGCASRKSLNTDTLIDEPVSKTATTYRITIR